LGRSLKLMLKAKKNGKYLWLRSQVIIYGQILSLSFKNTVLE